MYFNEILYIPYIYFCVSWYCVTIVQKHATNKIEQKFEGIVNVMLFATK